MVHKESCDGAQRARRLSTVVHKELERLGVVVHKGAVGPHAVALGSKIPSMARHRELIGDREVASGSERLSAASHKGPTTHAPSFRGQENLNGSGNV